MDTVLLRTFLEVSNTRHFARAADNLAVTQAAVSARIRQLEALIGQPLFTRARRNVQLTPAGRELLPYARGILDTWRKALLETGVGGLSTVVVGCLASLREIYFDDWLLLLMQQMPDVRLDVQTLTTQEAVRRVRDGSVDAAVVYEAPRAPDLWIEPLIEFELQLVAGIEERKLQEAPRRYIHVDWGPSAGMGQSAQPAGVITCARLDSPELARRLLLSSGGCAYLPSPLVAADIAAGTLTPVSATPGFTRSVHLVAAAARRDSRGVEELIMSLRRLRPALPTTS